MRTRILNNLLISSFANISPNTVKLLMEDGSTTKEETKAKIREALPLIEATALAEIAELKRKLSNY